MKFGYCLDLKFLDGDALSQSIFDEVCESGYDYLELPLSGIAALSWGDFTRLREELSARKLYCLACYLFFPPGMIIAGAGQDMGKVISYIEEALFRAGQLGVETVVFGSGGARRDATWAELRDVLGIMDGESAINGLTVVVEPLNRQETNVINSYTEAVKHVEDWEYLGAMCDWYHVHMDGQGLDDLFEYPDKLGHLHIAYGKERLLPSPNDDMAHYSDFVNAVKNLGYNNKLSVEGNLKSVDEIRPCLETLKKLFK